MLPRPTSNNTPLPRIPQSKRARTPNPTRHRKHPRPQIPPLLRGHRHLERQRRRAGPNGLRTKRPPHPRPTPLGNAHGQRYRLRHYVIERTGIGQHRRGHLAHSQLQLSQLGRYRGVHRRRRERGHHDAHGRGRERGGQQPQSQERGGTRSLGGVRGAGPRQATRLQHLPEYVDGYFGHFDGAGEVAYRGVGHSGESIGSDGVAAGGFGEGCQS
mmetsp:Transcript_7979/g.14358  ORF Transcript_7979/g.14358 Transcript_7979/m.14358 type:complete len:214 (-) Transcript_7979:263-904(-)